MEADRQNKDMCIENNIFIKLKANVKGVFRTQSKICDGAFLRK